VGDRPPDTYYSADIADYFAVRVLVLLDNERIVKPFIVVQNLGGGLAGIAKVRVVCFWMHPDESPLVTEHGFSDCGDDDVTPPSSPERVHSCRFGPGGGGHDFWAQWLPRATPLWWQWPPPRAFGTCRLLGRQLYPSVPLWTFVTGALSMLGHALSLLLVFRRLWFMTFRYLLDRQLHRHPCHGHLRA